MSNFYGFSPPPPRGPAMTRRPSYASVASGQPGAPYAQSRNSIFIGLPGQGAGSAHSYPPPQPAQHHHRGSDSADFHASNSLSESWERPHYQPGGSFAFGDSISNMMESRGSDFFVPSYLRGSRYIERLEEKQRKRAQAMAQTRDTRSGPSSRVGSLSTTPSSMNLHKFGPSYRGVMYDVQEKAPQQVDDTVKPLPSRWSRLDKHQGLELLNDDLEVKSIGPHKNHDDAASARTDYSIPKECGIYYYEVTILGKGKENQVGIGFAESKVRLDRLPGWEANSWAYHGDDGYSFCQTASGKNYGPKFGCPDVIGCGINFKTGQIFYTRNGNHLGIAFRDVKTDALYPSVGMKKAGEHIRANFGQLPFIYDIDSFVTRERGSLQEEIDATSLKHQIGHGSEASLMQEIIAQYLTHEGYTETARAFDGEVRRNAAMLQGNLNSLQNVAYKEDMDAVHRQRIRTAIIDGDIDKALKHTNAFYPAVLASNKSIYFKLRCRKFIEMIRHFTMLQPRSKRHSLHAASNNNLRGGYTADSHRNSIYDDGGYTDVFDGHMELDEAQDSVVSGAKDGETETSKDSVAKQNSLMQDALQYGQELRAEFRDNISKEEQQQLDQTFALIAYPDARDSSLAYLLEAHGRMSVAEELNSAILVNMGKASASAIERLVQQSEVLVSDLSKDGGSAALVNVRGDYMR